MASVCQGVGGIGERGVQKLKCIGQAFLLTWSKQRVLMIQIAVADKRNDVCRSTPRLSP